MDRWPDLWLGKLSFGQQWAAARDLHAAGLTGGTSSNTNSTSENGGKWTVELAMGFSLSAKELCEYSGNLTLTFRTAAETDKDGAPSGGGGVSADTNSDSSADTDTDTAEQATDTNIAHDHIAKAHSSNTSLTAVGDYLVLFIMVNILILIFAELYKRHRHKNIFQQAAHLCYSPIHYCRVSLCSRHSDDDLSGQSRSGNLYAQVDMHDGQHHHFPLQCVPTGYRHKQYVLLDKDETRSLIHACPKLSRSESDLTRRDALQSTQRVYHLSGRELHQQQLDLMPRGNRSRSDSSSTCSSAQSAATVRVHCALPQLVTFSPQTADTHVSGRGRARTVCYGLEEEECAGDHSLYGSLDV